MANPLRLMHLARLVVDEIHRLLDRSRPRLLNEDQLRECSSSITSNIREAYGRGPGRERHQFLRYSRASAEESDERLRTSFANGRLGAKPYWQLRDRLRVIVRMIDRLIE
jgi:four helix bundle protein